MEPYDPKTIEPKWQKRWQEDNVFSVAEAGPKKMYVLDMFPYPSGDGLHVGHVKIYTASDIVSRYLRMKGYNVLHPTGWDAFGLPTENSAIKLKIHPATLTERNIDRFRKQMQRLGLSYDWSREINTSDPNYYKWTQWIFLRLYHMGLAYQDTIPINWCGSCKTGLANEEVTDGKCERCGTAVEERPMRQWMLRITQYAERLLDGLGGLDWPAFIPELQRNWIGKSEGASIQFRLSNPEQPQEGGSALMEVFTTRADTLFGATYVVLSPNHPMARVVTISGQRDAVEQYLQEAQKPVKLHEHEEQKEKTGVFTGSYAINPVNQERIPIWIADYVLMTYGTGAIMSVPAHDERDYEFAIRYKLPIKQVIVPENSSESLPYMGEGRLTNSGSFDGQRSEEARLSIMQSLQQRGEAKKTTQYKLRDWVFSRQRYWGEPIPIIHCENCGTVPVPEEDLPVTLPPIETYEPTGTGEGPLAMVSEWVNVKCPTCPRMAKRETNTMPQWAGSSWYWLRYVSPHYDKGIADPDSMRLWLPVDLYVGGAEHAVLHLLYARFWQKVLYDAGIVSHEEPFQRFRAVGLVLGEDGEKMSKSRGNVINPDDVVDEYGADTLRVYESFMGPFDASAIWDTKSIRGARRFIERVWVYICEQTQSLPKVGEKEIQEDSEVHIKLHSTVRHVSESIEQFKFNTAVSALMELLNLLEKKERVTRDTLETFVLLVSPIAPHVSEELWSRLGHGQSLLHHSWPTFDEWLLEQAKVTIPIQVNGKVRGEIVVEPGIDQQKVEDEAKQVENVAKHLSEKKIQKVIYVPNRLINFVVK